MNSHISIKAEGTPLNLPEDFSIDIDDQNPLFNDNEMFSYPARMPMEGNRFLLGNIDDPLNVERPVGLEHKKMRILVDNQPFRSGTLVTSEDEEIDDALTMNISASEHSISDLIGTLSCRDVPLKDKIQIGEKIGNVTATVRYAFSVELTFSGKKGPSEYASPSSDKASVTFSPQALGFSCPAICQVGSNEKAVMKEVVDYANGNRVVKPRIATSFINVSDPYPLKPYCNARVAYIHRGLDKDDKNKTSDKVADDNVKWGPESHWPYWVLDADRQQSGICFYVLYFLECLFAHLGVSYDQSELLEVEDLKRLCFYTTHCKYTEESKYNRSADNPYFTSLTAINEWLESRGCGGKFEFSGGGSMQISEVEYYDKVNGQTHHYKCGTGDLQTITVNARELNRTVSADIMNMYATSDNFPDESVSTVLDSLFASFGIKFEYDYEKKHVRAYLVRNVFRSQEAPIDFPGKIISVHKVAEKITGVRMRYSEESTRKEQEDNLRQGKRDYNTDYDYIDYPEESTDTTKTYDYIFRTPKQNGGYGDMRTYIDKRTGNAYRIKVNSDAEKQTDLKPVLFEVGGYKGVEIGDCSVLNDEFVQEFCSSFQPVIFNDVNYQNESSAATGVFDDPNYTVRLNGSGISPIMSAFVDEEMEHEFLEKRIRNSLNSNVAEYYLDMVLNLVENYDPSSSTDGNSPLQEYDWGLAIAIMRGGGTDATLQTYDHNYDGFGNSKWRTVAGDYALTSDSMDMWGNEYDYNGVREGIGGGERFSLKIRAWKQPEWASEPLIDPDVMNGDEIETKIKSRGLFDTFMSELCHFYLTRRKFVAKIECSAAQVADVPNHWNRRFRFKDKDTGMSLVGYINKLSYSLSVKEGMKDLEVEFYVV